MPRDHELDAGCLEPVLAPQMRPDLFDQIAAMVLDPMAAQTAEVKLFVGMGQLPMGGSGGAQIRLTHQTQIGEQSQSAVHRGDVDPGVAASHPFGDALCGEVGFGPVKDLPDGPSRGGEAMTGTT